MARAWPRFSLSGLVGTVIEIEDDGSFRYLEDTGAELPVAEVFPAEGFDIMDYDLDDHLMILTDSIDNDDDDDDGWSDTTTTTTTTTMSTPTMAPSMSAPGRPNIKKE